MNRFAIFTRHVTARIAYLCRALTLLGYRPILALPRRQEYEDLEHQHHYPLLAADPMIDTVFHDRVVGEPVSHLFLFWSHCYPYSREEAAHLKRWAANARSVTLLLHMLFETARQRWKIEAAELVKYSPLLLKARFAGVDDLPLEQRDIYFLRAKKFLQPVLFPHVAILYDRSACEALYADFDPARRRSYRLNFLGSRLPATRSRLLDEIAGSIEKNADMRIVGEEDPVAGSQSLCLWHADEPGSTRARPRLRYIEQIRDSDFTLCPAGYAAWSTRPVESLLAGSIPILERRAVAFQGDWLKHGRNCLIVENGDWLGAVRAASAMSNGDLEKMRGCIRETIAAYLRPAAAARSLLEISGVTL
jgi:hypothetical protein